MLFATVNLVVYFTCLLSYLEAARDPFVVLWGGEKRREKRDPAGDGSGRVVAVVVVVEKSLAVCLFRWFKVSTTDEFV